METVRLDQGLFQTRAPNGLTVLTELAARPAIGGGRGLGAFGQRPRAPPPDGRLPPAGAHGVQGHRAPHAPASSRMELEVRGGSLDAYTSRDHTNFQAHVLDEDLPRAARCPDRPGPPAAAAGGRSRPRAQRGAGGDQHGRGHAGRPGVRPAGRPRCGPTTATAIPSSAPAIRSAPSRPPTSRPPIGPGYYPGNCVVAAAGNLEHEPGAGPAGAGGLVRSGDRARRPGRR